MAEGCNIWVGYGNVVRDSELRKAGNSQVLKFTLACNERYKDKEGEWKDRAEFIPVNVWGPRAEALSKFIKKGSQVLVEGSIHVSKYEKDGVTKYSTDVNATKVVLAGGKGGRSADDGGDDEPQGTTAMGDDDMPF